MYTFKVRLLSVFLLASLLATFPTSYARAVSRIFRVSTTPFPSRNCGGSWTETCGLIYAMNSAVPGDQIWVKAGTYKPTTGSDRMVSFMPKSGVAIYGGFAGNEMTLLQRDPRKNITTLSGDIGVAGNQSDNSYHVVVTSGTSSATILDGFTITGGKSDGPVSDDKNGAGMLNLNGSPTLANLILRENYAGDNIGYGDGGGIYSTGDPTLTNVIFNENRTSSYGTGGGMYSVGNPTLTNVTFSNNFACTGGGLGSNGGGPVLSGVTFDGNESWNGGGMFSLNNSTLTNVTISDNTAHNYGGGIYIIGDATLTNVTIHGNKTIDPLYGGGGVYVWDGSPILRNTILWGNTAPTGPQIFNDGNGVVTLMYSVIQGGCPAGISCSSNINADPQLATLGDNGGFTQTMPLLLDSPVIDRGHSFLCPSTDQRGVDRPQGERCDIGAYEVLDPVGAGVYDDSHPAWVYNGEWVTSPGKGAYNNTLHGTKTEDSFAYVTFSGVQVTLMYWTGPQYGSFDVYIDRHKVDTVDASTLMTSQATWTSPSLSSGVHTVFFVVTGRGWVDLDAIEVIEITGVGPGIYDDMDPAWTYSGTWMTYSGAGPYADTMHYTNETGATATLRFQAPARFILTYTASSNRSAIRVAVDGGTPVSIPAYSASTLWQQTYASEMYMDSGTHTITVSTPGDGSYIDVDALEIAAPVGAGTYDDAHSAWSYSGGWTNYSGAGPYNNTMHYTNVQNASAAIIFSGTQFTLYFTKYPNRGNVEVWIDGVLRYTFSEYGDPIAWQQTWSLPAPLPSGAHRVEFRNPNASTATYIDIDAIAITP